MDYLSLVPYTIKYNYDTSTFKHCKDLNYEFMPALYTANHLTGTVNEHRGISSTELQRE